MQKSLLENLDDMLRPDEAVREMLGPAVASQYDGRLRGVAANGDPEQIVVLTDLVVSVFDRYRANADLCRRDRALLYRLVVKTTEAIRRARIAEIDRASVDLQLARLLILRYECQRDRGSWIKEIPEVEEQRAKHDYDWVASLPTKSDVDRFVKLALICQAEAPMKKDITLAEPISQLIQEQPKTRPGRDWVVVARLKAWAFTERAKLMPLSDPEVLPLRALYDQYAIDICSSLGGLGLQGIMTDYDKEHLGLLAKTAAEDMALTREACRKAKVDPERALSHKKPVLEICNYMVTEPPAR